MKYIKQYESREVIHTLKTKAKSGIYEYPVQLIESDSKYSDKTNGYSYNGLILSIAGTPGSWYLSSFLHYTPDSLYGNDIHISGDDWVCTNKQEILKELLPWVKNEYPMWKDLKKYNL